MSDELTQNGFVLRLAEHLRSSEIQPGDVLPSESELMVALGVGRQQLREALEVLKAYGAISARQGARRRWEGLDLGTLIATSAQMIGASRATVADLLVIRQALETSLLAKVMPLHTAESRARLREIALLMEQRAAEGKSFVDLDEQFHLGLFAPLKNATLEGVLGAFWALLRLVEGPERDVAVDPEVAAMHTAIIDAIQIGDFSHARYELDTHFYVVHRRIIPSRPRSRNQSAAL